MGELSLAGNALNSSTMDPGLARGSQIKAINLNLCTPNACTYATKGSKGQSHFIPRRAFRDFSRDC